MGLAHSISDAIYELQRRASPDFVTREAVEAAVTRSKDRRTASEEFDDFDELGSGAGRRRQSAVRTLPQTPTLQSSASPPRSGQAPRRPS